jgi:hypothetical protein
MAGGPITIITIIIIIIIIIAITPPPPPRSEILTEVERTTFGDGPVSIWPYSFCSSTLLLVSLS